MKDILFWHYKWIPYLPTHLLFILYNNIKHIKRNQKKYKNIYGALVLYAYFKTVDSELYKRGFNKHKLYQKYTSIFVNIFSAEIQSEIAIMHDGDIMFEPELFHFKEHNLMQFRKCYNQLKIIFINNNIDISIRNKAHNFYKEYMNI